MSPNTPWSVSSRAASAASPTTECSATKKRAPHEMHAPTWDKSAYEGGRARFLLYRPGWLIDAGVGD